MLTLSNIKDFVGRELGVSSWITVDQARINQFADCTGDHQWIHVDVDRAKRESPFRNAVAHGYLTLSLIAPLAMEIGVLPTDAAAGLQLRPGQGPLSCAGQSRCAGAAARRPGRS